MEQDRVYISKGIPQYEGGWRKRKVSQSFWIPEAFQYDIDKNGGKGYSSGNMEDLNTLSNYDMKDRRLSKEE